MDFPIKVLPVESVSIIVWEDVLCTNKHVKTVVSRIDIVELFLNTYKANR